MIDEATPWVMHYRGLWGNDTHDPLGGERGPAGPRYERSGRVRLSWGDPIGWAGLRKVAPDARTAAMNLTVRLGELDEQIAGLDEEIERIQRRQRSVVSSGEAVAVVEQTELNALVTERVALRDERLLTERRIAHPAAAPAVHDHLRHRRLPLPTENKGRRRLLAIWSAISTSAILVVLIVALLNRGWTVGTIGIEVLIGLFAIEALARRELIQFALLVVVAFAVGALVITISEQLVQDWRLVVAGGLGSAAAALLFLNVRELLRD